ncbi:hypothetical protein GR11A_00213 [Vibrio phage vB_VcorM_GR11A]|nr:hypothetical protein GR11A_00213 [Vibrio phage vB_VcorM_GR11A]
MKTIATLNTALTSLTTAIVKAVNDKGTFSFKDAKGVSLAMQEVVLKEAVEQIEADTLMTRVGGKTPYYALALLATAEEKVAATTKKDNKKAEPEVEEDQDENEFDLEETLKGLDIDQLQGVCKQLKMEAGRKREAGLIKMIMEEANKGKRQYDKVVRRLPTEAVEEEVEEEQEEVVEGESLREQAVELGMKPKKAKKADEATLREFIEANTESKADLDDGDDSEDGEPEGGFVYVVFDDEDDAENFVKAAHKNLEDNGIEESDFENIIGHNGDEDEETYSHVYIDDAEFNNSLKARLKKFAKAEELDKDDYTVFTDEQAYLAEFSEEEVEPVAAFLDTLEAMKANKGKAKQFKAKIANLKDIEDGDYDMAELESVADLASDNDDIMEAIETLKDSLEGKELKAFNKAFKEWF